MSSYYIKRCAWLIRARKKAQTEWLIWTKRQLKLKNARDRSREVQMNSCKNTQKIVCLHINMVFVIIHPLNLSSPHSLTPSSPHLLILPHTVPFNIVNLCYFLFKVLGKFFWIISRHFPNFKYSQDINMPIFAIRLYQWDEKRKFCENFVQIFFIPKNLEKNFVVLFFGVSTVSHFENNIERHNQQTDD